jgi:hypothetical protein
MGNMFSICISKKKNKDNSKSADTNSNISEYRKIKVKDKIYTLFKDIEPKDCFEI